MDWFQLSYTVLGGLGVFFFGMKMLSEGLQAAASQWIRNAINTLTTNRLLAVLIGLSVTTIIQSSSITTVMVVGFVNAGLMQLSQAIGVILGANIGTTITGWIISIKIGKYSLLLIGLGIFPLLFSKRERFNQIGQVVFALGMIFLGLELMSSAFKPLRSDPSFINALQYFTADSYLSLYGTIAIGCALTFVIQSSSAMLAITIALATTGAITFQTALALVLGENIGTTITALLASIGANTTAKQAGVAHAVFNVFGVLIVSSLFWQYEAFIEYIIPHAADFLTPEGERPYIASHIAAGHTVFNVANVIFFIPFMKVLEKTVIKLVPDKGEKQKKKLEFFGDPKMMSPALGIGQARGQLVKMLKIVSDTFDLTRSYLNKPQNPEQIFNQVKKKEEITDKIHIEMVIFLGAVMKSNLSQEETQRVKSILRLTDELESLADYCYAIVKHVSRVYSDNINVNFDEKIQKDLEHLADKSVELYDLIANIIKESETMDMIKLKPQWDDFNSTVEKMKEDHLNELTLGQISPLSSLTLSDIVVCFRRIKNHVVNLAEAYQSAEDIRDEEDSNT